MINVNEMITNKIKEIITTKSYRGISVIITDDEKEIVILFSENNNGLNKTQRITIEDDEITIKTFDQNIGSHSTNEKYNMNTECLFNIYNKVEA